MEKDSSSEEEDVFAKLSKKKKGSKAGNESNANKKASSSSKTASKPSQPAAVQLPASTTSSMKRHHLKGQESRKAKMDALLLELEEERALNPIGPQNRGRGFVPEKKGSFVDPGEEHLTTNIFVGNLAPSITEEELTDLFRQFGEKQ